MIQRLVGLALRLRAVIVVLTAALIGIGLLAYRHLDIEAYPNPVPPLVEVIVQPPGWSGEEVERYVTIPLEIALAGMPGLEHMRSQSLFELSDVKCYFGWGTNYQDARQEADPTHVVRLLAERQPLAARVLIGVLQGCRELAQREPVAAQPVGVDVHLELLGLAAEARDVDHAGRLPELALEDPVLCRLALAR